MEYICPSCKSDNIQRLSVVFEGGLSNIHTNSQGTAIGIGGGGIGVGIGGSTTKGTSQTAASQRATPPQKKRYVGSLLMIFGAYMVTVTVMCITFKDNTLINTLMLNMTSFGWIAASAGWIYYVYQYNSKKWPSLKAVWDNSYLCNRCNDIFPLTSTI